MAKLILVVAIIMTLVGIWEFDELMMLHIIRKHKGDIEWEIPGSDLAGFGVEFEDGSRFIAHLKGGTWNYLILATDVDAAAGICIEDIKAHAYVTKFLQKCGLMKA